MVDVSGEAPVWEASLAAAMDFTRIGEAYGELLARFGFFDLQGRVRGRLDVAGTGDGRIATRGDFKSQGAGASLPFEDRSVRLEQSEVVLGWDLEANPADSEFVVRGVTVRAPNMSLSVEGTASPRAIDLSGDLEVALEPILAIGELFKPIPIGLAGDLRTRFSLKGTMGSDFRGELTVQSAGPVRYTQMGTEIFAEPLHLEASAEAKWKEGELAEVVLAIPSAGIGEEADAALDLIANMRDGTGVRGTARFSVGIPLILGFVPPERLDEMELEIAATGALEGNIAFDAPLVLAPELRLADQWNVTGDLITDLPEVEWLMGEMGEYLGGVRDERKFTVAINPNSPMDFLYSDHAVTSVGEVFGPMDLQVAEIRIENATRFQMEAPILIDLPSGRIGEFLFPTDTMALALPATTFASKMRIDLEESTFEVSRLDVAVQDVGAGGGTGNFNWGDFSWSLNSELEVSDLANAVALVTLEPTMTDLLPEVGGQVVVSTKLVGGDPRPPFDLAAGLPVRGNATINWKDVFAREDPMWWASGIAGSARFDSSDDGKSASLDWNVGIEELGAEAIRAKPVREFATHGRLNLRDFDELALHVVEIRAGNYDVRGEGKLTASGLKPFLLEGEGDGIESWLRGPRFDGNAFIRANLGAFDGAHPLLATGGVMDWTGRIGSTPGRLLEIESNLGADSVYLAYAEMFELEGLTGRWNAVKTYRLDPSVRLPSRPTEGKFTVARMAFSKPPASGDFVDSVVTIRGFETGLRLSVGVRDFLGGPATGSFSVTEESGAPVLRGEMEITGLRGGKLSPSLRDLGAREDEMSGIATMSWRIPDSPESNVLDDLSIRLRSTQIGKKALSRLLQALDANQDDPRFQNAIMALNFGAPVGGHFFLENSMISMGTRLRLPAGVMLPLPILDRAPLSEIIAVYGMQQRAGAISALHDPLLLMLQTDLYAGESMTTQAGALP